MKFIEADVLFPHAEHAFGTKEGSHDNVEDTIRDYTEILGPIAHMRQVHGDRIVYAGEPRVYPEADAIVTDRPDLWLAVKTADCVPVLLSCPQAVAAVHCGWRGLQQDILAKTIEVLQNDLGVSSTDIHMMIGPCIRQHNYEVENEFKTHFPEKFFRPSEKEGFSRLDLAGVAKWQATEAGLIDLNIHDTRHCTFDKVDMFNSHRRNKEEGNQDYNVQLSLIKRRDS